MKRFARRRGQESTPEFSTNYEKYVHLVGRYRKEAYAQFFAEKEREEKDISRAKQMLRRGGLNSESRKWCEDRVKAGIIAKSPEYSISQIEAPLIDSHLFLVGPATSESLFGFKPSDYQYIQGGKLPFDNCYFELVGGVETKLPGLKLDAKIEGIQLSHKGLRGLIEAMEEVGCSEESIQRTSQELDETGRKDSRDYVITAFMEVDGNGPGIFTSDFAATDLKKFQSGELLLPRFKHQINYFGPLPNMRVQERKDRGNTLEEMSFQITAVNDSHQPSPFSHPVITGAVTPEALRNIDPKKASEFIESLYCFNVNLINYINSHNVTVEKGDFEGRPQTKNRSPHSKPYNLITVRDEVQYASDEPQESDRHLEYRIYVRGHSRRLKNGQGVIYRTTWVSPHVRGPEDAPWREQRYQILAAKLQREKALNKCIGEKGYLGVKEFRQDNPNKS
jgi:hypothetical protein